MVWDMVQEATSWQLHVDVSHEWLFIRIGGPVRVEGPSVPLAEQIWAIATQHGIYRLVLELDWQVMLTSRLIGQVVRLHKRVHKHAGVVRLCGLSVENYQVLETMRLEVRFPNYRTREDAVMGYPPTQPR